MQRRAALFLALGTTAAFAATPVPPPPPRPAITEAPGIVTDAEVLRLSLIHI